MIDIVLAHDIFQANDADLYQEALTNELLILSCEKRVNHLMNNKLEHQIRSTNPFLFSMGQKEPSLQAGRRMSFSKSLDSVNYMKSPNMGRYLPRPKKIDWEDRVEMLAEYKRTHGHCMVPQSHPTLGSWVKWQREKYALYEEGKSKYFTREKVERLDKLGFVWRMRRKRRKVENKDDAIVEETSGDAAVNESDGNYEKQSKRRRRDHDEI